MSERKGLKCAEMQLSVLFAFSISEGPQYPIRSMNEVHQMFISSHAVEYSPVAALLSSLFKYHPFASFTRLAIC